MIVYIFHKHTKKHMHYKYRAMFTLVPIQGYHYFPLVFAYLHYLTFQQHKSVSCMIKSL